jgi:hypothetical protein
MIRQHFHVENYWEVIVYYNTDYDLFYYIYRELKGAGMKKEDIIMLYDTMKSNKAKAVTYSNTDLHKSIVLFNKHLTFEDYLNSIVHEAEHVKQAMLKAYHVKDKGENPAYTIGYLVMKMWEVFKELFTSFL